MENAHQAMLKWRLTSGWRRAGTDTFVRVSLSG